MVDPLIECESVIRCAVGLSSGCVFIDWEI